MIKANRSNYRGSRPHPIMIKVETPTQVTDDEGNVSTIVEEKLVDYCSKEIVEQLPTQEEYKLENLLAAGVPLTQVPTNIIGVDTAKAEAYIAKTLDELETNTEKND